MSKYGVDIGVLDEVAVPEIERAIEQNRILIVDEIGKMELFSTSFREAVLKIISSGKKVLGTIMSSPHPWADLVKQKPQVKLIEVTRANHSQVLKELSLWLGSELSLN